MSGTGLGSLTNFTSDVGSLRTSDALLERQVKVHEAAKRLLKSESMVKMLEQSGVELPNLDQLERKRFAYNAANKSDWRSALGKREPPQLSVPQQQGADAPGSAGTAGEGPSTPGEMGRAGGDGAAGSVPSTPGSPTKRMGCLSPSRLGTAAGGSRVGTAAGQDGRRGSVQQRPSDRVDEEPREANPVIARLKKLKHKVLFGRVGEKAYEKYKSTLRANLTWRDILRPKGAGGKGAGDKGSRMLANAFTAEQVEAVRREAAVVIQRAWRVFAKQRLQAVMKHVKDYELGHYDWSDDDSVATEDLPDWWGGSDEDDDSDDEEGGGKKRGKGKKGAKKGGGKGGPGSPKKGGGSGGKGGPGSPKRGGKAAAGGKKKGGRKAGKEGGAAEGDVEGEEAEGEEDEDEEGSEEEEEDDDDDEAEGDEVEDADGEGEGGAGGKAKKWKAKLKQRGPPDLGISEGSSKSFIKKRMLLAAVAQEMDEDNMGDAVESALELREAKKKAKAAKKGRKGGGAAGEGGEGEEGEEAEGDEAEDGGAEGRRRKNGKGGRRRVGGGGGGGGEGGGEGEEGEEGEEDEEGEDGEEGEEGDEADGGGPSSPSGKRRTGKGGKKGKGKKGGAAGDGDGGEGSDGDEGDGQGEGGEGGEGGAGGAGSSKGKKGGRKRGNKKGALGQRAAGGAGGVWPEGSTAGLLGGVGDVSDGPEGAAGRNPSFHAGGDGAAGTAAAAEFHRAAHASGLFDVTVDPEKRAAILARMAKDQGPQWRPTGVTKEDWGHFLSVMSSDHPDATPERKAALLDRMAAHPAWRPTGAHDPHLGGYDRGLNDGPYDDGTLNKRAMLAARQKEPQWRPAGTMKEHYISYHVPSPPESDSDGQSDSENARARRERRASGKRHRAAARAAAGEHSPVPDDAGTWGRLGANGRPEWRIAGAATGPTLPVSGNAPAEQQYSQITRDLKAANTPWRYATVTKPPMPPPASWGPYEDPLVSPYVLPRHTLTRDNDDAEGMEATAARARAAGLTRRASFQHAPRAHGGRTSEVGGGGGDGAAGAGGPPAGLRRSMSLSVVELDVPQARRAAEARAALREAAAAAAAAVDGGAAGAEGVAAGAAAGAAGVSRYSLAGDAMSPWGGHSPPPGMRRATDMEGGGEAASVASPGSTSPNLSPQRARGGAPARLVLAGRGARVTASGAPTPAPFVLAQPDGAAAGAGGPTTGRAGGDGVADGLVVLGTATRKHLLAPWDEGRASPVPGAAAGGPGGDAEGQLDSLPPSVAVTTAGGQLMVSGFRPSVMGAAAAAAAPPRAAGGAAAPVHPCEAHGQEAALASEQQDLQQQQQEEEDERQRRRRQELQRTQSHVEVPGLDALAGQMAEGLGVLLTSLAVLSQPGETGARTPRGATHGSADLAPEASGVSSRLGAEPSGYSSRLGALLPEGSELQPPIPSEEPSGFSAAASSRRSPRRHRSPDRPPQPLYPAPMSEAADSLLRSRTSPLKRANSARGMHHRQAFSIMGIQPFPLEPELLRGLPGHLTAGRGALSVPGSPRGTLNGRGGGGRDSAGSIPALRVSGGGGALCGEASTMSTGSYGAGGMRASHGQLPPGAGAGGGGGGAGGYGYGYGCLTPEPSALWASQSSTQLGLGLGTAGSTARLGATQLLLSAEDLPALPKALQDAEASEHLAARGARILAARRQAAKGSVQPNPRQLYELLMVGPRTQAARAADRDKPRSTNTSPTRGDPGGKAGGAAGAEGAGGMGRAGGGGGMAGVGVGMGPMEHKVKLSSSHPMARMYQMHGVDPSPYRPYTWSRGGMPYGPLGETTSPTKQRRDSRERGEQGGGGVGAQEAGGAAAGHGQVRAPGRGAAAAAAAAAASDARRHAKQQQGQGAHGQGQAAALLPPLPPGRSSSADFLRHSMPHLPVPLPLPTSADSAAAPGYGAVAGARGLGALGGLGHYTVVVETQHAAAAGDRAAVGAKSPPLGALAAEAALMRHSVDLGRLPTLAAGQQQQQQGRGGGAGGRGSRGASGGSQNGGGLGGVDEDGPVASAHQAWGDSPEPGQGPALPAVPGGVRFRGSEQGGDAGVGGAGEPLLPRLGGAASPPLQQHPGQGGPALGQAAAAGALPAVAAHPGRALQAGSSPTKRTGQGAAGLGAAGGGRAGGPGLALGAAAVDGAGGVLLGGGGPAGQRQPHPPARRGGNGKLRVGRVRLGATLPQCVPELPPGAHGE